MGIEHYNPFFIAFQSSVMQPMESCTAVYKLDKLQSLDNALLNYQNQAYFIFDWAHDPKNTMRCILNQCFWQSSPI